MMEIGGFRVEREIRRSGTTVSYEATQVDLERRVALTVLSLDDPRAQRFQAAEWPEHRHVVSLFAAGESEHGFLIATRLVPGAKTLAERIAAGDDASGWIAEIRDALSSTGAVHGALEDEWSLLVDDDDRALITGFGLGPSDATAADDARALAALERMAAGYSGGRRVTRQRRRRATALAAAGVAAATALVLILVATGENGKAPERVPPAVAPGMVALGSALAPGPVRTLDCEGDTPSGGSQSCTAMQTALPGRTLVATQDGTVRRWHVRGATGEVALRVIRRRDGRFVAVGGSGYERVDGGLDSFPADAPIRVGDLIALELAPGSGGGYRSDVEGATTTSFISALGARPLAPNPPPGTGRNEEIMLRVDYVRGPVSVPVAITGPAAARASEGRRLGEQVVDLPGGRRVRIVVVALADRVVVDVFRAARRRARIEVADADPDGRLVALNLIGEPDPLLVWLNPDGARIDSRYQVTASSIKFVG